MRLLRPTVSLLALLLAAACSTPPHSLPERGETRTFTVSEASDVVYRKVVEGARTCYSRMDIAADYFPDNRSARVSMSKKTGFSIASLFMANINPSESGTNVQVFFLKGNPVFADAVEQWTKGNYTNCPFM
jgi:hypothetical protein